MIEIEKLAQMLKGVNHASVAKRAGTTRSYVNQIASGARTNPTLAMVSKLLEAMQAEKGALCAVCLSYYEESLEQCPACDSSEVM